MDNIKIICLRNNQQIKFAAAVWFHSKWGVPQNAYEESIDACILGKAAVPQWYVALKGDEIIGGVGVIKNDFHERVDLTPNVCALYVEKDYRCRGIAGRLLQFCCDDMKAHGVGTLYLVTNHDSFYERYGWMRLCTVKCDDGEESLMYTHES